MTAIGSSQKILASAFTAATVFVSSVNVGSHYSISKTTSNDPQMHREAVANARPSRLSRREKLLKYGSKLTPKQFAAFSKTASSKNLGGRGLVREEE
jgi:hypothetical protein